MGFFREIVHHARQVTGPVVAITFVVYFAYHALQGDRGVIALGKLERQVAELETERARLSERRSRLEARARQLHPDSIDRDMLGERARLLLGYGNPEDMVLMDPGEVTTLGTDR